MPFKEVVKASDIEALKDALNAGVALANQKSSEVDTAIQSLQTNDQQVQDAITQAENSSASADAAAQDALFSAGVDQNYLSETVGQLPDSTGAVSGDIGAYPKSEGFYQKVQWDGSAWQEVGLPLLTVSGMKVNTVADLENRRGWVDGQTIQLLGYYSPGDGGGDPGIYWDATSNESAEGGTIWDPFGDGTAGRWKRPQKKYYNPMMFGAKGDWNGLSGTDDYQAINKLTSLFNNIDWLDKSYLIESPLDISLTSEKIDYKGSNAKIVFNDSTHRQYALQITPDGSEVNIKGLSIDANQKADRALSITNDTDNDSILAIEKATFKNAYRADQSFFASCGIFVQGAFSTVHIDKVRVSGIAMASGAGIPGSQGISGIILTHTSGRYTKRLIVDGVEIEDVYSEDDTYEADQDGLVYFVPHNSNSGNPIRGFLNVQNTKFKNCFGRSIKSQSFFNRITGSVFDRDSGFASGVGNPEIDLQVSGGTVSECDFFYENGQIPSSILSFSSNETSGGTDYKKSSLTVRDIKVYGDGSTTLENIISTSPGGSLIGNILMERVDVFTGCVHLLRWAINGVNNYASIKNCNVDEVLADSDTDRALVRVISSGDEADFKGVLEVSNCVNTADNEAFITKENISGNQARTEVSAYSNYGFHNSHVEDISTTAPDFIRKQAMKIGRIGTRPSGVINEQSSHDIQAGRASNDETVTFEVPTTAFIIFNGSRNRQDNALFTIDSSTNIVTLAKGSGVEISGGGSEPASGGFRIWKSAANEISISNRTGGTEQITIWVLSGL